MKYIYLKNSVKSRIKSKLCGKFQRCLPTCWMDHSVVRTNCIGNFTVFNIHNIIVTIRDTNNKIDNSQSPKHQNLTIARHKSRYLLNHNAVSFRQLNFIFQNTTPESERNNLLETAQTKITARPRNGMEINHFR